MAEDHKVYYLPDLVDDQDLSEILVPSPAKYPRGEKGDDTRMLTLGSGMKPHHRAVRHGGLGPLLVNRWHLTTTLTASGPMRGTQQAYQACTRFFYSRFCL